MRATALLAATGLLLCWALPVSAAPPRKLADARKLIDDLEFEAAIKALDAAEKTEGNDRATVLEILTLQGVAFGTLGKDTKTLDCFRKLLVLDPSATLPPDLPPRVKTPFFEAKDWASRNGPVAATATAEKAGGVVAAVTVTVEKDALRLARAVRFHLEPEGVVLDVALSAGKAQVPVGRPAVSWRAEVLGERRAVLLDVASREDRVEPVATPVAARTSPGPEPVEPDAAQPSAVDSPVAGGWRRPTGSALLGAAAVAGGVGVVFGALSSAARARVVKATRDDLGRVTGLTQREAAALEVDARGQATAANVLLAVGGGLLAAGVVLVVLGPSSEPAVVLTPTPGGFAVTGSF